MGGLHGVLSRIATCTPLDYEDKTLDQHGRARTVGQNGLYYGSNVALLGLWPVAYFRSASTVALMWLY